MGYRKSGLAPQVVGSVENYLGIWFVVQDYRIVVQNCGTELWYRIVVEDCGTEFWYRIVVQDCGTGLWYRTVVNRGKMRHYPAASAGQLVCRV